jgi:hypothetical protein
MKSAQLLVSALVTGSFASVVSTAALAALAKAEGKRAAQPANSTSHWLHGERAASFGGIDFAHTGIGLATHHEAVVDYGITPKRLTPGWELTLSKPSMAGAFAGLALGLAAGALASRRVRLTM